MPTETRLAIITYASGVERTAEIIKDAMAAHGYRDGVNTTYLVREGGRDQAATQRYAEEVVAWGADLVFSLMTNADIAMKQATERSRTPVVFWAADAIAAGLVHSYRRPGTNFTGFCYVAHQQVLHVRLLRLLLPRLRRLGHLYNPTYAPAPRTLTDLTDAGAQFGVEVVAYETYRLADFEASISRMRDGGMDAFTVGPHELFNTNGEIIGALAQQYGLPATGLGPGVLRGGGVAMFSPPLDKGWPAMASVAARILGGEDPASIPVERRLLGNVTLNVAAAERLGLAVPEELRDEADRLI